MYNYFELTENRKDNKYSIINCTNQTYKFKKFVSNAKTKQNEYFLVYITHGIAAFRVNKKLYKLRADEFIFIEPNTEFEYAFSNKKTTEYYLLDYYDNNPTPFSRQCELKSLRSKCRDRRTALFAFENLILEFSKCTNENNGLSINVKLENLLVTLEQSSRNERNAEKTVYRLAYDINKNYFKEISVEEYADEAKLSMDRFTQLFKKIVGFTPHRYQLVVRLRNATTLISQTKLRLPEISNMIGFERPLYFSRLYKKYTGIAASSLRKDKNNSED